MRQLRHAEAMELKPRNSITQQKIIEVNNRRVELANSIEEERIERKCLQIGVRDSMLMASRFDEAINFYEQAMNLIPGNPMAYENQGSE